jgi:hypothetical protein
LWEETKKIIKICSLTPPTACKSEWGPPRDHQEFDSSNEVRVTLLVDERYIIPQTRQQTRSPPSGDSRYDKSTVSPTAARAREALAIDLTVRDSFVDEELAPRAIPTRINARKPQTSAYERPPARSSTFGQLFPAAAVASKSRRPDSRGRPRRRGNRRFDEPFRPEPVVARGPGRVDCRGRVPSEHSASPRRHSQGQENQGEVCPLSRSIPLRPVLRFPCICPIATRGNEDGSGALLQLPPEQEDKKSPFSSMELKFELNTRLTVSCVVAVASAYGLLTV